ncbi:Fis family transcriptional regulator [Paraglaciecola sp. 20A4]|uniref:Fis family transcriptional regulator n=1 Tax=Paraglaciecola sp. 20A4 TaxID=2687288 RepID=UPI00140C46A6|nr:Fis family transcriptional regulator [Paraglaciecola sp. 20A4]
MQKTVKKLDNNVIKALTNVCELAKRKVSGFQWITHTASYDRFPASLTVICVFDTQASLEQANVEEQDIYLRRQIQTQLLKVGIKLKDARHHVRFDTEQACEAQNNGNWQLRIKTH